MKLQKITIIVAILIVILTTACSPDLIQIGGVSTGMVGSNLPGGMAYSFITFNDSESQTVPARSGQTLSLDYDVTVHKGSLQIELLDPEGEVVWEELLDEDASAQASIELAESGRYRIAVRGKNAGGSFHLAWLVE